MSRLRLLRATPKGEDPVVLLQAAAREYIPIDPNSRVSMAAAMSASQLQGPSKIIPDPEHRPSIEDVVAEIQKQDWYADQIVYDRVFEPKSAQIGVYGSISPRQMIRYISACTSRKSGSATIGKYHPGSPRFEEDYVLLHPSSRRNPCFRSREGCYCVHKYRLREKYNLSG